MSEQPRQNARGLACCIVRHRVLVVALWVCAIAILIPEARQIESRLEIRAHIRGGQAASVEADLARRFHSPYADRVVLLVRGLPAPSTEEGRRALSEVVTRVANIPGVGGTLSSLDEPDPLFLGDHGESLIFVGLTPGLAGDTIVPRLRSGLSDIAARLRARYPSVELGCTGETLLNFDLRRVSSEQARTAEFRVLPLALVLLFLAFGTLVAASLPILMGILSVLVTLGLSAWLARRLPLSILTENVASMIGLGLGIDYALLMVSRFRESMRGGMTPADAAVHSIRQAGHTLVLSAFPVAIGFAALLTIPISELYSMGIAGLFVTGSTLLISITLLPAILSWLGPRLEVGRAGATLRNRGASGVASERWRRWGRAVAEHPILALILAGVPVLLLASQAARLKMGTLENDWLPPRPESVRVLHSLERMDRGNIVQTIRVILDLPAPEKFDGPAGWSALVHLSKNLAADPRVARVHSLPTVLGFRARPSAINSLTADALRSLLSEDRRSALIEVLPASPNEIETNNRLALGSSAPRGKTVGLRDAAEALARDLRNADASRMTGLTGARIRVGGLPATNGEFGDVIEGHLPRVLVLVSAVTLVALFVGFRSALVSIKAVLLNLLTVAASFGLLVLVFQDGLWGLIPATGRIFSTIPPIVFCVVFGLSMDYEVILVARVREARRGGLDERGAIAEGVARTAGVITSAASIMIAVFGAFAFGSFLPIQMLGLALSGAVLIDATLIRLILGPALLQLAGKWNWWPAEVSPAGAE